MKVMVIGSEGYIGRPTCAALAEAGHEVLRIDTKLGSRRSDLLRDGVAAVEAVVDLAGMAHFTGQSWDSILQANASEPALLYQKHLRPAGVRLVMPSSLSVFADGPYPESKRLLERLLHADGFDPNITLFRFGTVYGGFEPVSFRRHLLLNSMVCDAVEHGRIHVRGAAFRRPVLSLTRAVRCLVDAATQEEPGLYNGTVINEFDTCGTLLDFARLVQHHVTPTPAIIEEAVTDTRDYGWGVFQERAISASLRELVEWAREAL